MSEIVLRLDSEVYLAGDTIYGAVYLKVNSPTSGYGIKVSTKGRENYFYHDVRSLTIANVNDDCVTKNDVTLLDEQLILCMLKGPFAIGQYVFPFKQILPRHLTGSFEQHSWHGPKWEAHLGYHITAEVIGSEYIKTSAPFRVSALFQSAHCPHVNVKHRVRSCKLISAMKTDFSLDVSLDKAAYCVGETVKIKTQLNSLDTPIKRLCVKLLRSVRFVKDKSVSTDRAACSHCNPNSELFIGEQRQVLSDKDFIWPEDGVKDIWSTCISIDKSHQCSQIPTVFLLLSEDHMGFALQPSIHGQFIQCHYTIQLDIHLEVGETQSIQLPLPHVGPEKTGNTVQEESDWMGRCALILHDKDPSDGKTWTGWNTYSKLAFPTLQLMRSPDTRRRLVGKPRSSPYTDVLKLSAELDRSSSN